MAHPFQKMFVKALTKSDEMNNLVTTEAQKLIKKGYSQAEIYAVLHKLEKSLIDESERAMVAETIEELALADSINETD